MGKRAAIFQKNHLIIVGLKLFHGVLIILELTLWRARWTGKMTHRPARSHGGSRKLGSKAAIEYLL